MVLVELEVTILVNIFGSLVAVDWWQSVAEYLREDPLTFDTLFI